MSTKYWLSNIIDFFYWDTGIDFSIYVLLCFTLFILNQIHFITTVEHINAIKLFPVHTENKIDFTMVQCNVFVPKIVASY